MEFDEVTAKLGNYGFGVQSASDAGVVFHCPAWPQELELYELHGPLIKFSRRGRWGVEDRMSHKLHIEDRIFKRVTAVNGINSASGGQPFKRFHELNGIIAAGELLKENGVESWLTATVLIMDVLDASMRIRWEQENARDRFMRIGKLASLHELSVEDRLGLISYKLDVTELRSMLEAGTPLSVALELFDHPKVFSFKGGQ